jgi:hypothetical protein
LIESPCVAVGNVKAGLRGLDWVMPMSHRHWHQNVVLVSLTFMLMVWCCLLCLFPHETPSQFLALPPPAPLPGECTRVRRVRLGAAMSSAWVGAVAALVLTRASVSWRWTAASPPRCRSSLCAQLSVSHTPIALQATDVTTHKVGATKYTDGGARE